MARLRQLAHSRGIGLTGAPVTRLRAVGLAFQRTVLRSLDIPANTTKFASPGRGGPYSFVIPDAVVGAGRIQVLGGMSFDPAGGFIEVADGCLDFAEVKAGSCTLTLSSARRQLAGFIDVLARRRPAGRSLLGSQPPRPALLLVSTSDTQLAPVLLSEAARRGVAIFQAWVYEQGGFITVGAFSQKTRFADVPPLFSFQVKSIDLR